MVRIRYVGVTQPELVFDRYRQARRDWCELRSKCTPMGPDYKALDALISALDAAAAHFTGQEDFYGGRAPAHRSW